MKSIVPPIFVKNTVTELQKLASDIQNAVEIHIEEDQPNYVVWDL